MIIVYHQTEKIIKIAQTKGEKLLFENNKTIAWNILQIAKKNPNENIVWCEAVLEKLLNLVEIEDLLKNQNSILSFGKQTFLLNKIGYIDESPFIKINKKVRYPTWLMSAEVGIVSCDILNLFQNKINTDSDFEYFLNSIAKLGMPEGLLCYSEPKLLNCKLDFIEISSASNYDLFKFTKQHYKSRWLVLLFLNLMVYEFKFPILPLFFSFFYRKKNKIKIDFENSFLKDIESIPKDYDVLIPTIGRKKYLYDFLKNLNEQNILPTNVIIIEQNPFENSVSELDYLTTEKWNFNIKHTFTNQSGACNARNVGILQAESFWTFLADDDISVESDFSEKVFSNLEQTNANAATINCHLINEKQFFYKIFQWQTFGSGCSFIKTSELKKCEFLKGFELGFGEDADFGIQLRNLGTDILYFPEPKILHHKAPIGGFRTKPIFAWSNEKTQPKPSPTVMLYQILHNTKEQVLGYKIILFFKYYRNQKIKNPIKYFSNFQKQWKQSVFWANELKKEKW